MRDSYFAETELILSPEGRIYHLDLLPEDIADTIILVGDLGRVSQITQQFEQVEFRRQHREFITHTGYFKKKHLTVISTGIGTDNMEIVCQELDALASIDLKTRLLRPQPRKLKLIRLGTCGGIQPEHDPGTLLVSAVALGLDGLSSFYQSTSCLDMECALDLKQQLQCPANWPTPYAVRADSMLLSKVQSWPQGITLTAPGFYAPQGRQLRLSLSHESFLNLLPAARHKGLSIVNFEMETSVLYFLGSALGHQPLSICVVVGNRYTKTFSKNVMSDTKHLIDLSLEMILGL